MITPTTPTFLQCLYYAWDYLNIWYFILFIIFCPTKITFIKKQPIQKNEDDRSKK